MVLTVPIEANIYSHLYLGGTANQHTGKRMVLLDWLRCKCQLIACQVRSIVPYSM